MNTEEENPDSILYVNYVLIFACAALVQLPIKPVDMLQLNAGLLLITLLGDAP